MNILQLTYPHWRGKITTQQSTAYTSVKGMLPSCTMHAVRVGGYSTPLLLPPSFMRGYPPRNKACHFRISREGLGGKHQYTQQDLYFMGDTTRMKR